MSVQFHDLSSRQPIIGLPTAKSLRSHAVLLHRSRGALHEYRQADTTEHTEASLLYQTFCLIDELERLETKGRAAHRHAIKKEGWPLVEEMCQALGTSVQQVASSNAYLAAQAQREAALEAHYDASGVISVHDVERMRLFS